MMTIHGKCLSYKWVLLLLLSCAFFFHQADRVLFGLLTIPIQEELHLTDIQIGLINTSLFCTLAIANPIAGFVGDRFSRKWIITFSLLFWSLMTACTGLVGGMCGLVFFRSIATGGGESFYGPSAYALLASHHKETRSIAFGVHQAALYIGLMFSGAIVGWALHLFGGWRSVFYAFGGCGLLLGILFIFALKDRVSVPGSDVEAVQECKAPPIMESLRAYFCNPAALLASSGLLAIVFVNNAYLCWAPKFVARKFDLTVGNAGNGTMLYHHLAALAAIIVGGILTDVFSRKYPRFRLTLQSTMLLLGAPMIVMVGFAPTVTSVWIAVALFGICRGMSEVNSHPSLFDVIDPRHRSTADGLMTMVAFFFGSLSPLLMGALSDRYGIRGFEIGFGVLAFGYVIGAGLLGFSALFVFDKYRVPE